MRLVRCEQCGAKALIAATQCPRCTHPLDLRDSRGDAVPLAYCPECDTYYPRSRGGCKWCGTKPAAIPVSPWKIWAAIGAGLVVIALGIWQYRVYTASRSAGEAAAMAPDAATEAAEAAETPPTPLPVGRADTAGGEEDDSLHEGAGREESLKVRIAGGVTVPPAGGGAAAGGAPAAVAPGSAAGAVGGAARAAQPPVGTPPAGVPVTRDRYSGPWSRAVAIEWVNVRVDPSRDAAVAGVVTPGTTVQLGEIRAGWRRVRSAGVEGWADARFFSADTVARR